jgi:SAM-dependent methyltransferase
MLEFLRAHRHDTGDSASFDTGESTWGWRHGVLVQPELGDFYWGEVEEGEMNRALQLATEVGWREAVRDVLGQNHPHLVGMVESRSRVDWLPLLAQSPQLTLDIGSGWGQTSVLLADVPGNEVVSLERIGARSAFQAIRRAQERIEGLHLVNGDLMAAALPSSTFDLATFIGVLEWIGVAGAPRDPRDVQLDALRRVHDLLRPGGQVVVGIENRIGFNNFLGARDHSGLRFTSLMPRKIASVALELRRTSYRSNQAADAYRTYTYTMAGYRRLLDDAGFHDVRFWVSHPHYADPKCLIEADNATVGRFFDDVYRPSGAKDVVFTQMFRGLAKLGLAAEAAPHFVMIGTRS